ncbi:norbelladine synthase-like [Typha angustifolia]|uniref:norbelladine synthase-like n=1 Tax=Typha angustifolia TaxID=59011 RepID=UPI003C2CC80F
MKGTLCHEEEVGIPADEVWQIYGTIKLAELVVELLPNVLEKFDLVQGDGGVDTILHLTCPPGNPGPQYYKEKFVKIDNERRVKEAAVVEGGYLELGFRSFLVRFEILEKESASSSIIKSTVEYEIDQENASLASIVTIGPVKVIAEAIAKYLMEKKSLQKVMRIS